MRHDSEQPPLGAREKGSRGMGVPGCCRSPEPQRTAAADGGCLCIVGPAVAREHRQTSLACGCLPTTSPTWVETQQASTRVDRQSLADTVRLSVFSNTTPATPRNDATQAHHFTSPPTAHREGVLPARSFMYVAGSHSRVGGVIWGP